jgi:hypothetical protein
LKVPDGCAICQSTWGNYWAEVEGQKMFFCCEICEVEFRNMLTEIKRRTGWKTIDEIEIAGDTRGRVCAAISNGSTFRFEIRFNSRGEVDNFKELHSK